MIFPRRNRFILSFNPGPWSFIVCREIAGKPLRWSILNDAVIFRFTVTTETTFMCETEWPGIFVGENRKSEMERELHMRAMR